MRTDYEMDREDLDDVIDEEELVFLREQKDLKKHYRELFNQLKTHKEMCSDNQS